MKEATNPPRIEMAVISDIDLHKIIKIMNSIYGKDISIYNEAFLQKTLEKRYSAIGVKTADAYCRLLEENGAEADILFQSLNIRFSRFFRDALTCVLLEQQILPGIINGKPEGGEIRIWSAGCACGQEAYSVAILLDDLVSVQKKNIRIRIFATDISHEALAGGRAAVYDADDIQNVPLKYLEKYFIRNDGTFTIIPDLKKNMSFLYYDLLERSSANPPESIYGSFDVIICSNVFIYYKPEVQQYIMNKLQKSMSPTGFLVTGEAERVIVDRYENLQMVSASTVIFKRKRPEAG